MIGYSLSGSPRGAIADLITWANAQDARERAGELYVANIGVPPALYARAPVNVVVGDLFSGQNVIRVW